MKAIIVDDEPIMLASFLRLSSGIEGLDLAGKFQSGEEALEFARQTPIDLAFLDIAMPVMNGIELAKRLRQLRPDILIVFISAYDEYIRESNQIGGDYYIVKPYKRETLEMVMDRLRLIAKRQQKSVYIQMFGRFTVLKDGAPVHLQGKAKEILALIATRRGREISNEEIFSTIWETRTYSNDSMSVYYNALRRLKNSLEAEGLSSLLLSTSRGQMINTELFDCDYYAWLDHRADNSEQFRGEFLSEYSWGESLLAELVWQDMDE